MGSGFSMAESRYVWWKHSHPGIQVFLWRLCTISLSMVDNLRCWITTYPSQCAFCRMDSDAQDHVFLQCSSVCPLWTEISVIFSGPMPSSRMINAHLYRWWRLSNQTSMMGYLRATVPSIVTWVMWKEYVEIRFGSDHFDYVRLYDKVKMTIYTWCSAMNGKSFATTMPQLVALNFSPPLCSKRM